MHTKESRGGLNCWRKRLPKTARCTEKSKRLASTEPRQFPPPGRAMIFIGAQSRIESGEKKQARDRHATRTVVIVEKGDSRIQTLSPPVTCCIRSLFCATHPPPPSHKQSTSYSELPHSVYIGKKLRAELVEPVHQFRDYLSLSLLICLRRIRA